MKNLLSRLFGKEDHEFKIDQTQPSRFLLKIEGLLVGILFTEGGLWKFRYSKEFRQQDKYRRLIGFSDLEKEYQSEDLWPFFKIRIPGLKQPMIQEILEKENIDKENEAQLLKRFGERTMTNPYVLEAS